MKAIELTALDGFDSLRLSEVDKPSPAPGEVLIKVRAAGSTTPNWNRPPGATRCSDRCRQCWGSRPPAKSWNSARASRI